MTKQDKATTEKHTRILRDLVKRPENKFCADCKRNDARWASWNLGVFICIRCSGIHRSMGTHISKVKSVDLDTWTSEQMQNIQIWGNHRANIYWEAHLRPGHVPPEHKMESFIRSKYESRRWARDGPIPSDPSSLEQTNLSTPVQEPFSSDTSHLPSAASPSTQKNKPHQLLSSTNTISSVINIPDGPVLMAPLDNARSIAETTHPIKDDIFSLDFHSSATSISASQVDNGHTKDVKNGIMSLFTSSNSSTSNFNSASPVARSDVFSDLAPQTQQSHSSQILRGLNQHVFPPQSTADSNDPWAISSSRVTPALAPVSAHPWSWSESAPMTGSTVFVNVPNVWDSHNGTGSQNLSVNENEKFKAKTQSFDAFDDIWSDFK